MLTELMEVTMDATGEAKKGELEQALREVEASVCEIVRRSIAASPAQSGITMSIGSVDTQHFLWASRLLLANGDRMTRDYVEWLQGSACCPQCEDRRGERGGKTFHTPEHPGARDRCFRERVLLWSALLERATSDACVLADELPQCAADTKRRRRGQGHSQAEAGDFRFFFEWMGLEERSINCSVLLILMESLLRWGPPHPAEKVNEHSAGETESWGYCNQPGGGSGGVQGGAFVVPVYSVVITSLTVLMNLTHLARRFSDLLAAPNPFDAVKVNKVIEENRTLFSAIDSLAASGKDKIFFLRGILGSLVLMLCEPGGSPAVKRLALGCLVNVCGSCEEHRDKLLAIYLPNCGYRIEEDAAPPAVEKASGAGDAEHSLCCFRKRSMKCRDNSSTECSLWSHGQKDGILQFSLLVADSFSRVYERCEAGLDGVNEVEELDDEGGEDEVSPATVHSGFESDVALLFCMAAFLGSISRKREEEFNKIKKRLGREDGVGAKRVMNVLHVYLASLVSRPRPRKSMIRCVRSILHDITCNCSHRDLRA
eukprot:GHVU01054566.1.p1 GENE.GHVU01054566.1~~GHVU01054566.1.p1  ORF type:complete len:542 (-),score=48.32 GHVU01054566.1:531-2156(-)